MGHTRRRQFRLPFQILDQLEWPMKQKGDRIVNRRKGVTVFVAVLALMVLNSVPASIAQEPARFTGQTIFAGVFTDSGFVFAPADWNYCDASATVVQDEGGVLVLEVTECGGMRTCIWEFTVSGDGVAEGGPVSCVPDFETGTLVGDVELHTGCKVGNGTYPVYQGTWDGSTLSVAGDFLGPCDGGTYWGGAAFWDPTEGWPGVDDPDGYLDDGVTAADGPAHVTFSLELAESPADTLPETGGSVFPIQQLFMGLGGLAVAAGLGMLWLRRRTHNAH